MLRLQSRAYALWSQRVAAVDALLSRDLRALAEALAGAATSAERARTGARELVESGDLDQDQ